MSLGFDCCWVFLWWVLPSSWLIEVHSIHHILYSVVQMWTVCVEADSSVRTRFWGFSLALVQLFSLSNFSTIYLYFQISPGLRSVWLPLLLHLLPLLSVGSSFVGGFPLPAGVLVFIAPTLQVLWSSRVKFVLLSWLLGWPLFGSNSGLFRAPGFIVSPVGKGEKRKKKRKREGREKE